MDHRSDHAGEDAQPRKDTLLIVVFALWSTVVLGAFMVDFWPHVGAKLIEFDVLK